jgi:hypothetical protein
MVPLDAVARVILAEHRGSPIPIGRAKSRHGGRDSMDQHGALATQVSPGEDRPRRRIKSDELFLKESGGAISERENLREALVEEIGQLRRHGALRVIRS